MPSLIKVLLKIPGLKPEDVSRGLKAPPFIVFSTDKEDHVNKLKSILEKFGAMCAIENTNALKREKDDSKDEAKIASMEEYLRNRRHNYRKFRRNFWIALFSIIIVFAILSLLDFSDDKKTGPSNQPKKQATQSVRVTSDRPSDDTKDSKNDASKPNANAAKTNFELKKEIKKNPYNADAWKNLVENLEKQGDAEAAHQAKESYDKVVKTQMVLANLARAFGNRVRVEIKEDEVYYRTAYDFTDEQFYREAGKLMSSMNEKFPGKDLVVENYTSNNKFQSVKIKSPIRAK
jgi:hypothetical protein